VTPASELDAAFRESLAELDEYLDGLPEERLTETVLPFASRWILPDSGFDLEHLRDDARSLVQATPLSDRILAGFADQVAWWISQRMLLGEGEQPDLDRARRLLAALRGELKQRAVMVEAAGFARIAAAFRLVLEETAGGEPPDDLLWRSLALRIAESVL
jgi:hypothetical protein